MLNNNEDVEIDIMTKKKQASVKLINNTGREIISYAISHHYSSVFKHSFEEDGVIKPASG